MKRIKTFLITALAGIVGMSAFAGSNTTGNVSVKFDVSKLAIKEVVNADGISQTIIKWDTLACTSRTGKYTIPFKKVSYAIPFETRQVDISGLTYHTGATIKLNAPLMRAPAPMTTNGDLVETDDITNIAPELPVTELYGVDSFYDLCNIATFVIYPVIYNEKELTITPITEVSFNYDCKKIVNDRSFKYLVRKPEVREKYFAEDYSELECLVENPEEVLYAPTLNPNVSISTASITTTFNQALSGEIRAYEYCIVTSQALAPAFRRLVCHKRMRGIEAGIVYIENILNNTSYQGVENINDHAGVLRAFLSECYQNGTRYVLMGGKPHIVPIRYGRNSLSLLDKPLEKNIPTDFYFSNVQNNWNQDGDNYYGEFQFLTDLSAQLKVGRLLCISQDEINNYIDKLEFYENNPGHGDVSYLDIGTTYYCNNALNFDCHNILNSTNVQTSTNSLSTLTYSDLSNAGTICPAVWFVEQINDIKPALMLFHCHGDPEGFTLIKCRDCWPYWSLTALDAECIEHWYYETTPRTNGNGDGMDKFTNFQYPNICYSISCNVTNFDSPSRGGTVVYEPWTENLTYNLAESYTLGKNYGGVAMLGNTRVGYFEESTKLENAFFQCLNSSYNGSISAAENYACSYASINLDNTTIQKHLRYAHNLVGDPTVYMWQRIPTSIGQAEITRTNSGIEITCPQYSSLPRRSLKATLMNTDGTSETHIVGIGTTALAVSPKSLVFIGKNNHYPYFDDIILSDTITDYKYFYGKDAYLGNYNNVSWNTNNLVIAENANVTIDVSGDVFIENVTLKNNAKLTIYAEGTVHIKSLQTTNTIVDIQADACVRHSSAVSLSSLSAYKYNKHGYYTPQAIPVQYQFGGFGQHSPSKDAYRPFVEPGKRWNMVRYYEPSYAFWPPRDKDNQLDNNYPFAFMYYEIGEPVEIDGKTYCPMYCCPDIEKEDCEENILIGYLREDCELRQVWFQLVEAEKWSRNFPTSFERLIQWTSEEHCTYPEEEFLLYDFIEMKDLGFDVIGKHLHTSSTPIQYEFNDGVHKGFKKHDYFKIGIYEGIGAIEDPELWNVLYGHELSDPFGFYYNDITGGHSAVLVCSVIAPDGTPILDIKLHDDILHWHEMLGIDANESTGTNVWVDGNLLKITAPGAIGQITVTDMTGRIVISTQADGTSAELPLNAIAKGIYAVKTNALTRKIAVN